MELPQATARLARVLDEMTDRADAALAVREGDRLRCLACGHRCLIGVGKRGICKVRFNREGQLRVPFGYVAGVQCDPVEKKPFFHVHPGSDALTFGMMGCDYHCPYCQNWVTSQALRDESAVAQVTPVTPEQLIGVAHQHGAKLMVSSYNEPLITSEWSAAVFRVAKPAGLTCAYVSNGNATDEVLDYLSPWLTAYKVDLKSFNQKNYQMVGGVLDHVTSTIAKVHARGWWCEVVTLLIPTVNDDEGELRAMAQFLASVSRDIPWHVTAFHPDYQMHQPPATTARQLMRACEIGSAAGLRYVYAGNLPGAVGEWENTRCHLCHTTLVRRYGFLISEYHLTPAGSCPSCQTSIAGRWPSGGVNEVNVRPLGEVFFRVPRRVRV